MRVITFPRLACCVATLSVLAVGSAPTTAAAATDRCVKSGRTSVATTKDVRVFSRSVSAGTAYYACARRTGRSTRLWVDDGVYTSGVLLTKLGRYVAFSTTEYPACKANCPPGVEVTAETTLVNVVTRRRLVLSADTAIDRVLLTSKGSAAWLTGTGDAVELHIREGTGIRVHDTGAIDDLRLSGRTLTYTKGGAAQSVVIA